MNLEDLHNNDEGFEIYNDNKKVDLNLNPNPINQTNNPLKYKGTTIARLYKPEPEEDSKWDKYRI